MSTIDPNKSDQLDILPKLVFGLFGWGLLAWSNNWFEFHCLPCGVANHLLNLAKSKYLLLLKVVNPPLLSPSTILSRIIAFEPSSKGVWVSDILPNCPKALWIKGCPLSPPSFVSLPKGRFICLKPKVKLL